MQKKQKIFSSAVRNADLSHVKPRPALTIRLHTSHGMAAVTTACNKELCDTIAQLVTWGRHSQRIGLQ